MHATPQPLQEPQVPLSSGTDEGINEDVEGVSTRMVNKSAHVICQLNLPQRKGRLHSVRP